MMGYCQEEQGMRWRLRLYVRGNTPLTQAAVANLEALIREHLAGVCTLEVLDISSDLERAAADDIVAVPTLLRLSPGPMRRIVGDLTQTERVLQALEVPRPMTSA